MSYEIDEKLKAYFDEMDPKKREEILNTVESDETGFLHRLYSERYQIREKPRRLVDLWLWKCVYMPGLYKRRRMLKKATRSELLGTIQELHLTDEDSGNNRALIYFELRNAVRRYLSTCNGAKYASSFFGLKKATEEEKHDRATEDIWKMSRGIARAAGFEKEMDLWCQACFDELMQFDSACRAYYDELESSFDK